MPTRATLQNLASQPSALARPQPGRFGPSGILFGVSTTAPHVDLVNGHPGTITGSIAGRSGWIQTSSGNFLTGGARPDFDGATLTVFCEVELTSAPTSGQGHFVGTIGDQFIKLHLNFAAGNVGFNSSVYIAGSHRGATEITKGTSAAVGDTLFCGFTFNQPDLVSFAAWNGGALTFGAAGAYGAPIADSGSALYIGRDSGGTNPFSGYVRSIGVSRRVWSRQELHSLYRQRWQTLLVPRRIFVPVAAGGGSTIATGIGAATASGTAATIDAARTIATGIGAASATGTAAAIDQARQITTGIGAATAAGTAATISTSSNVVVATGIGAATAAGTAATVDQARQVNTGIGAATAAGTAASIIVGSGNIIVTGIGAATASGTAATLERNIVVGTGIGAATAAGTAATIQAGDSISVVQPYVTVYFWRRTA